ncbi:MAG: ROK family protein [Lachnospiraceae bacterium]|jgi:fructokinase|nr:ROK family protein [Lachnospiraceae bacterium]MCH4108434.1 ROK family protein [Lachnospiraceae bacterium]MCI1302551.1 ROK family protein [Lachnospiraceae bacterium]MCI1331724.1 ROK family protein [Lachnospiraceae bacterium]MCI1360982.1 ROK family protein [Lachnospiraceae bacterium]
MLLGGIEAGGTKMVCALGDENGNLKERVSIPTREPEKCVPEMIDYFRGRGIQALGLATFGPADLNKNSPLYGHILKTPKPGWEGYDFAGAFRKELGVPVGFDTDVNGAILGEVTWGAAKGCSSAIYITVGTGIGVGVYVNGGLLHGLMHPEAGHILLARHPDDTAFAGGCPFHRNCAEGLAAGRAIELRWGQKGAALSDRKEVWELESYYLGQAIADYICTYSPEKIILWGGVMHQPQMFDLVREKTLEFLSGYFTQKQFTPEGMKDYITAPALGDNPGIMGALKLAAMQLAQEEN